MAQIQSGAGSDLLTIDTVSKAARASLYDANGNPLAVVADTQPASVSGLLSLGMNDRSVLPMRLDRFGSQAQASHQPMFVESFEGGTLHPIRWTSTATTMAATQSSIAGLTINSGAITTVTTGYMLKSNRAFLKSQRQPLHTKIRARPWHFNNSVMELGFGDAATFNGAHTTGAYWQVTATGVVQPVLTYNGVDQTGADVRSSLDMSKYYTFDVFMDDDEATYIIQDTSTGLIISKQSIKLPLTAQRLWSATQLPVMLRCYNTGVAPATAPQLTVTDVYVALLDGLSNAPQSHIMAMMHRDATANVLTGVQAAQFANSAAPASATLSNTAGGYATLGGLFQFAAVAGAATDYALFGFQVPSPATLVITGIDIEAYNTGAAVATTPTTLVWGLAANQTAVSLATAGAARVGLGVQSLPIGTVVGGNADRRISKQFQTPIVCGPGRWLDIILRIPVGTATASQVIAGMVNIEGYFI